MARPVYLQHRTYLVTVGMAESCQEPTHAPQQTMFSDCSIAVGTRITSHPRTHQCMQRDDSLAHGGCPCAVFGGFWSGEIDSSTVVDTGRCSTATGFGRIAA